MREFPHLTLHWSYSRVEVEFFVLSNGRGVLWVYDFVESDERKKGRKHYFGRQVRKKKKHILMGMNDFPPALSLVKGETF